LLQCSVITTRFHHQGKSSPGHWIYEILCSFQAVVIVTERCGRVVVYNFVVVACRAKDPIF
jgi:hypothetical protein